MRSAARQEAEQQLELTLEVSRREVFIADAGLGGVAERARPDRARSSVVTALPNDSRSAGSTSTPELPDSIWSWIPPTRLATVGRPCHIASATEAEAFREALLH